MAVNTSKDHLYSTAEQRADTVAGISAANNNHWRCVRLSRVDYDKTISDLPTTKGFAVWLAETWGIKIHLSQNGHYLSKEIDIINEEKYTMFMLKYS
jgi:hypothetical protein